MPRKSSKPSMDGDGLLPSLLLFLAAGAYYFLSAQTIINRGFVHPDVRQMVGLMCLSDSSFCVLSGAWSRRRAALGTKRARTRKERRRARTGLPRLALYALPVFDMFGLVVAFEAFASPGASSTRPWGREHSHRHGAERPAAAHAVQLRAAERHRRGHAGSGGEGASSARRPPTSRRRRSRSSSRRVSGTPCAASSWST